MRCCTSPSHSPTRTLPLLYRNKIPAAEMYGAGRGSEADAHRPYKCTHCSRRFAHASTLSAHKATHRNDRREYICPHPGCGKSFGRSYTLNMHKVSAQSLPAHQTTFSSFVCSFSRRNRAFPSPQCLQVPHKQCMLSVRASSRVRPASRSACLGLPGGLLINPHSLLLAAPAYSEHGPFSAACAKGFSARAQIRCRS